MSEKTLVITGYSDDIIELDGSISDEIYPSGDEAILKLPDATRIKVFYDNDGIWRTNVLNQGRYNISIQSGDAEADTNDVLTVNAPIPFVIWSCADGKKGVCGHIVLSDEQQSTFTALKEILEDSDEFSQNETLIKAIVAGIEV